jgi:riboflavin kinase/FMN adenylyltransferase
MPLVFFPDAPPPHWPRPVVALGNFDGVHRGHLKIIECVRQRAGELHGTPVVLTFEPHPPRVLRPDRAPRLLMTFEQKLDAFARAGMAGLAVVRFSGEIASWSPEAFVDAVLVEWLGVAEVWVGANFLFGRDRAGTYTLLKAIGEDRGFVTQKIEPVRYKDFVVSSSRIRHLIEEGRVDEAAALLGHHYFLDGVVVHGDHRGRTLGYPTANLRTANELLPAYGVYATIAIVDGVQHAAVTSLGVRPTIGDNQLTIETFLLDAAMDLYDRPLRLAFVQRIRAEARFDGLEALRAAIADDCARARALFAALVL